MKVRSQETGWESHLCYVTFQQDVLLCGIGSLRFLIRNVRTEKCLPNMVTVKDRRASTCPSPSVRNSEVLLRGYYFQAPTSTPADAPAFLHPRPYRLAPPPGSSAAKTHILKRLSETKSQQPRTHSIRGTQTPPHPPCPPTQGPQNRPPVLRSGPTGHSLRRTAPQPCSSRAGGQCHFYGE